MRALVEGVTEPDGDRVRPRVFDDAEEIGTARQPEAGHQIDAIVVIVELQRRRDPGGVDAVQLLEVEAAHVVELEIRYELDGRGERIERRPARGVVRVPEPDRRLVEVEVTEVAVGTHDHDRALIVGQTSFGKGLVQSVYPLSKNAGLALTTQKWYTPSGRLIQRDYSQISQYDYYNHRDNPTDKQKQDIHQSDHGRVVYGGGGITPDHVIEEPKLSDFEDMLINKKFAFFTFVRDFLANNPAIDKSFQVSDAMVNDFKQHLRKRGIQYADKDFDASKDFIKREIRREVFYNRLGTVESEHVRLEADPLVLKAIEYLPEAKDLSNSKGQRKIAQK